MVHNQLFKISKLSNVVKIETQTQSLLKTLQLMQLYNYFDSCYNLVAQVLCVQGRWYNLALLLCNVLSIVTLDYK